MKKGWKAVCGIALSLMCAVTCMGYAQLTTALTVKGKAQADLPETVFISSVSISSTPSGTAATVNSYTQTVLNSKVTLGSTASSAVTLRVTVYNNTRYEYVFNKILYEVGATTYDNEAITVTAPSLKSGESKVEIGGYLTFDVTFSYKNSQVSTNRVLNSILNFEFVPAAEYVPEIAVHDALGKFEEILNNEQAYQALLDAMADGGFRGDSYIGNVAGATTGDSGTLNTLFTDEETERNYLTLTINDKVTEVTAIIKNEDLTGDGVNEMTIYMTGETIGRTTKDVDVYVAVYQKDSAGAWIQLGELYQGMATANNYYGVSWLGNNSFNTDTWESSVPYYNDAVVAGSSIEALVAKAVTVA